MLPLARWDRRAVPVVTCGQRGGAATLAERDLGALSMLVSTLVPTALHAGAVIMMLSLWFLQPAAWRPGIVQELTVKGKTARTNAGPGWASTRASWWS